MGIDLSMVSMEYEMSIKNSGKSWVWLSMGEMSMGMWNGITLWKATESLTPNPTPNPPHNPGLM